MPPFYPLAEVQRLAASPDAMVHPRKTTDVVLDCVELPGNVQLDLPGARRYVLSAIQGLRDQDFVHQNRERTPPADVYRWTDHRARTWYVKLKIQQARLHVISFHPAERPL